MLLQDQLDIAFICGLPFARRHRVADYQLQALVAPVMQHQRYQNQPIYFSDIIVNADSNLSCFDDLVGKTLCYNDPGSNSGYNLLRQRLIQAGYPSDFFGKVIQSGSHQRSIQLIVDSSADCSAIDSTVLEQELSRWTELSHHLRVIESIGPSPMPLVVVAKRLGSQFIDRLHSVLLKPDIELQLAMSQVGIQHYVSVHSEDYIPIGLMYDAAVQVGYKLISSPT